jgi:hypothetical protein
MVCTQQVLLDDCSFFHYTLAQGCYILVTMFQNLHHKLHCTYCLMTSCRSYHQLNKIEKYYSFMSRSNEVMSWWEIKWEFAWEFITSHALMPASSPGALVCCAVSWEMENWPSTACVAPRVWVGAWRRGCLDVQTRTRVAWELMRADWYYRLNSILVNSDGIHLGISQYNITLYLVYI